MFCPEDGMQTELVEMGYNVCYDCPACGTHWIYYGDEGSYVVVEKQSCPSCGEADDE